MHEICATFLVSFSYFIVYSYLNVKDILSAGFYIYGQSDGRLGWRGFNMD